MKIVQVKIFGVMGMTLKFLDKIPLPPPAVPVGWRPCRADPLAVVEAEFNILHSTQQKRKEKKTTTLKADRMAWLICTCLFSAFMMILYFLKRRVVAFRLGKKSPPALPSLPIIGSLLSLKSDRPPHIFFQELQKKYGDTYSLKLGSHNIIIVNSHQHAKEVLIKKGKTFAGRPRTVSRQSILNQKMLVCYLIEHESLLFIINRVHFCLRSPQTS